MKQVHLAITGMTCDHCARTIEQALRKQEIVTHARVRYPDGIALVQGIDSLTPERVISEIEKLGYGASETGAPAPTAEHRRVVIIGSGSAAFAAAIEAADQGANVLVIESGTVGGTCVNVGCVPSKHLIHQARDASTRSRLCEGAASPAEHHAEGLARQRATLVEQLRHSKYESIIQKNPRIELMAGKARFRGTREVVVTRDDGSQIVIKGDRILIATGRTPYIPDIPGLAETPYWTSTDALAAPQLPKRLLVLGGSVVALELSQAFLRLGSQVTLLTRSTVLSRIDAAVGAVLVEALRKEGMVIHENMDIARVDIREKGFAVQTGNMEFEADRLLVATGRRPNTHDLNLQAAGVATHADGSIIVDTRLRTSSPFVFAAGDCTASPQFVYVAAAAGTRAAINMLDGDATMDLTVVPEVIFTEPQVGLVGLDETTARDRGIEIETRTLPLRHIPRAIVDQTETGFIKLVAEKPSGKLLGAQIVAPNGGEIIQIAAMALKARLTVQEIGDTLFPYLTMTEGIRLCAQTFHKDVTALSCCAG